MLTYRNAIKFYVPLVIQAVSQSFTYPLVAVVVSHGALGVSAYDAFVQGQAVMFILNALCHALLTTIMVYGTSRQGFQKAHRLNMLCMAVIAAVQVLCSRQPISTFIFARLLQLPPESVTVASESLLYAVPIHIAFFIRNSYSAILYNALASNIANMATLVRIAITAALSYACVRWLNFTGHFAGSVTFAVPAFCEALAMWHFARPYIRRLPAETGKSASIRELLSFTVPLAFGNTVLSLSGFVTAAFIAYAADPARMRPIHYIALGIINPIAFGALRMQTVAIAFASRSRLQQRRLFIFTVCGGLTLGAVTLLGQIPAVARFYFGTLQNLGAEDIPLAMSAILVAGLIPVFQALRGHAEGLAAHHKRPSIILAGQVSYLAILVCALYVTLRLDVPGNLMGVTAIIAAVIATTLTVRVGLLGLKFERQFTLDDDTP